MSVESSESSGTAGDSFEAMGRKGSFEGPL